MRIVTGAMRMIVVTLSRNIESTVVTPQDQQEEPGSAAGALPGEDRQVLEEAALLEQPDEDHHPQEEA